MQETNILPICAECGSQLIVYADSMLRCSSESGWKHVCYGAKTVEKTICPVCFSPTMFDGESRVLLCSNCQCPAYKVNSDSWEQGHYMVISHSGLEQGVLLSYIHDFHVIRTYTSPSASQKVSVKGKYFRDILVKVLKLNNIDLKELFANTGFLGCMR